MSAVYERIDEEIREWVAAQPLFFVATAPLADDGLVNCSPKGLDTLRVIDDHTLAYLDITGSGVETIAHLRENGRIVVMLCAFTGAPRIVRFHGEGEVVESSHPDFADLVARFDGFPGVRSVIRVHVSRVADTCGYGVPLMDFKGHRKTLSKWAASQGDEALAEYRAKRNAASLDGLPGLKEVAP